MKKGILYLIPSPLGEDPVQPIPGYVEKVVSGLKHFVAERAKTARKVLKDLAYPHPLREAEMVELTVRTSDGELEAFLDVMLKGQSVGVLSEAGCPGIADPGARAVAWAHRNGIRVVPLIGPSSILLALMASGMNGQSFCFHGYLPQKRGELVKRLRYLEQQASSQRQTQIFIETPYRNEALLELVFQTLKPGTFFCVAADLTLPTEYIATKTIGDWTKSPPPDLHKRPALFLLL